MHSLVYIFGGLIGIFVAIVLFSLIMMWLSAPVLLYFIYQTLRSIEKKINK